MTTGAAYRSGFICAMLKAAQAAQAAQAVAPAHYPAGPAGLPAESRQKMLHEIMQPKDQVNLIARTLYGEAGGEAGASGGSLGDNYANPGMDTVADVMKNRVVHPENLVDEIAKDNQFSGLKIPMKDLMSKPYRAFVPKDNPYDRRAFDYATELAEKLRFGQWTPKSNYNMFSAGNIIPANEMQGKTMIGGNAFWYSKDRDAALADERMKEMERRRATIPSDGMHTVSKGDTLGGIAERYGLTQKEISSYNPKVNPTRMRIGGKINLTSPVSQPVRPVRPVQPVQPVRPTVTNAYRNAVSQPKPSSISYTVSKGDTLWSISRKYGSTVSAIMSANPGISARTMSPGSRIRVPLPRAAAR